MSNFAQVLGDEVAEVGGAIARLAQRVVELAVNRRVLVARLGERVGRRPYVVLADVQAADEQLDLGDERRIGRVQQEQIERARRPCRTPCP